jgi:hypothetical protein
MTSHEHALAALNQRMAELGAANPAAWAGSKVREGIPERARYLALRRIWATALSPWRDRGTLRRYPSLARLLDRGATRTCWPQPAATSSSNVVGDVIMVIDEGYDPGAPHDSPGWALIETSADSETITGRAVGGLHESLLQVDPEGKGSHRVLITRPAPGECVGRAGKLAHCAGGGELH